MLYECVFLAYQGLSKQEIDSLIASLSSMLKEANARIVSSEYWGLFDLSYQIKKHKKAYYFMLYVDVESSILSNFEKKLKLNELVIRYMFLKVDKMLPQNFFLSNNE